tara:strand:- start:185 stop:406 length:222 start_codon:yes stop_codon:yes gene_type:complete
MPNPLSEYEHGGLDRKPVNILRLISELEGSYQLLKWMAFDDDMNTIEEMKGRYYKIYFKLNKEEKNRQISSAG